MTNRARVIGIHPIAADEPVHLVELEIADNDSDFDFGQLTQELLDKPRSDWQAVYDEREVGRESGNVRYAFFFHYLDTTKPFLSPVGPLVLPPESPVPKHLRSITYEPP